MPEQLAIHGGRPVIENIAFPVWPVVSQEEIDAVVSLLKSNTISIYDRSGIYAELEDNFAAYHNVKYALAHNSGTSALHAAFFAVGLGPGDEVLAPTYTFLATVTPVFQTGATPVLCEMDSETLNIDIQDIEAKINERTKAIVVTHMWGHPCEMDELRRIADANNLVIIEDCSHAHGATYKDRKVGTLGHIGCFSLEGHKAVHAGEGGMMITDEQEFYERAVLLGHFGKRAKQDVMLDRYRRYVETGFGHKYRIHPLGAAIANVRLKYLDQQNAVRRENMDWFSERIAHLPAITTPITRPYCTRGGWYGYKPKYEAQALLGRPIADFIEVLRAEGAPIKKPGSKPLHLLPLFGDSSRHLQWIGGLFNHLHEENTSGYRQGDFPVAEQTYAKLLSFPVFAVPAKEHLELIAQAVEKVVAHFQEKAVTTDAGYTRD